MAVATLAIGFTDLLKGNFLLAALQVAVAVFYFWVASDKKLKQPKPPRETKEQYDNRMRSGHADDDDNWHGSGTEG